jgi:hypothetical protein
MKFVAVPVLVQRRRAGRPLTSIVSSRTGGPPEDIPAPVTFPGTGGVRLNPRSLAMFDSSRYV